MTFWNFARSTASVRLLMTFGEEQGVPAATLLRGTGLSAPDLVDPALEITAKQELRVVSNLVLERGDPVRLGIEVGRRYRFSTFSLWGYGLISSATGLEAIALALRFLPLTYAYCPITFHQENQLGVLRFDDPGPSIGEPERSFLTLRDMAAAATLGSALVGGDFALRSFTLRAPERVPDTMLFGMDAEVNSAVNSLVFDLVPFERSLPNADPVTSALCEQMCSSRLQRRCNEFRTSACAHDFLSALPPKAIASLSDFALFAGTSERTIKRRLHDEGTSFSQISADFRYRLAKELLNDTVLNIADIAERVGFSDASSFSQAYKKWSGVAPSHYRRRYPR